MPRATLSLVFGTLLFAHGALAGTIVSVDGPDTSNVSVDNPIDQILAVGWTSSSDYSDVSIAAEVGNYSDFSTITAFLTTAVGPGETDADQIATYTFSPGAGPELDTLFSGLDLSAGTYYLVLAGQFSQWWGAGSADAATLTADTGVTFLGDSYTNSTLNANLPASAFMPTDSGLLFQVTDGASDMSSTPEPASGLLLTAGFALLLFRKRS
jgi:hypothetical protein